MERLEPFGGKMGSMGTTSLAPSNSSDSAGIPVEPFRRFRYAKPFFSQRSDGLSIEVNLAPDPPSGSGERGAIDIAEAKRELEIALEFMNRRVRHAGDTQAPPPVRTVLVTGRGEPTLCPNFLDAIQAIIHLRAARSFPFFHIVLLTNTAGFARNRVQSALKLLTRDDGVWISLHGGTREYLAVFYKDCPRLNFPLPGLLANAVALGRRRPIVIDTMWPVIEGVEPPATEIEAYIDRLKQILDAGASISRVQLYSVRSLAPPQWTHLPLSRLSRIARRVSESTQLRVELF